jgi:hypothetical protein
MSNVRQSLRKAAKALPLVVALGAAAPAKAQVPSFAQPPLQRPTFHAAIVGLALPLSGVMDALCIQGSAGLNKVVRVKRIEISGTDTTAQSAGMSLVLRSVADTGGTSTVLTNVPSDQNTVAGAPVVGTATVRAYTVAPTPGTAIGPVRAAQLALPTATTVPNIPIVWTFDPSQFQQEIVLRGAAQSACLNFPGAFTTAGPTVDMSFEWTE